MVVTYLMYKDWVILWWLYNPWLKVEYIVSGSPLGPEQPWDREEYHLPGGAAMSLWVNASNRSVRYLLFFFFHFYSTFDPIRGTPKLWHTMVNWKKAIPLNSDVGGLSRIPSYS